MENDNNENEKNNKTSIATIANGEITTTPTQPPKEIEETNGDLKTKDPGGQQDKEPGKEKDSEYQLYWQRWLVLGIFVFHSMTNAFQWIQYSIITNTIITYYGITTKFVDWTSMVYMVTYIPLIFPAAWLLEKKGLRFVILLGSFGTMLGAWVKCGSLSPDRWYVSFIGQTICAVSQIFILGIPPRLASVWFGAKEVSTACAIGVFGNQLGVALGFLIPPILVPNTEDTDAVTKGLSIMFFGVAVICSIVFILIVMVFRREPPTPPSPAAALSAESSDESYLKSILRLIRSVPYILLLITYGINVGVFYAISTLLSQVFTGYFPGEDENAGRMGLLIVISGMLGSVVTGFWLDKTHKFKETTLAVYIMSLAGMVAYTFIYRTNSIPAVFTIAALLGFFMTGYLPLGFEFAAEITYPESEGTSSGLLNASAQIFGIAFVMAASALLNNVSDQASNLALCGTLAVGSILTALIKSDLKRQAAQQGVKKPDENHVI